MLPDLPQDYYLDNVLTLFKHVETVYADILDSAQRQFLAKFSGLSCDAQKLYIRLLNRSNLWFRASKLNYTEINSIAAAMIELEAAEFLLIEPDIEPRELISLFSKSELLAALSSSAEYRKLKRDELEGVILNVDNNTYYERLRQHEQLIRVQHKDCYLICQMLFFGNLNQSMTDFVLRDLGLYQYESYSFDAASRPYRSNFDIQQHWILQKIQSLLELCAADDEETWLECFDAIPEIDNDALPLYRQCERVKYHIARQLERCGNLPLAYSLYERCVLPPSRERQCRILHQQGHSNAALELCKTIIKAPYDDQEIQFASAFGQRITKQLGVKSNKLITRFAITHQPPLVNLDLVPQARVEQAVLEYYLAANPHNQCFYLENSLFNAVLGLLIWDVVFTPVAGAFYHPFQHRPADLYAHDFVKKRQHLLTRVWSSLQDNNDIWQQVTNCWQQKFGLSNPLVNWQAINLDTIQLALQRISFDHWIAIFKRIMLDLRQNRAGFPDLVLFPAAAGYLLIEVKGPTDSLQKNQLRWMHYFSQHDIPHCIARVSWKIQD